MLTPAPLIVRVTFGSTEMVKALAPAVKSIALTSTDRRNEIAVMLETLKVATSDGPLGTVAGVQLVAVFQTPVAGSRSHVALPP